MKLRFWKKFSENKAENSDYWVFESFSTITSLSIFTTTRNLCIFTPTVSRKQAVYSVVIFF